jgi:hypothetical protein
LKNGAYKPSKMYDSKKLNFNKLWVPKYLNEIRFHIAWNIQIETTKTYIEPCDLWLTNTS